MIRASLMHAPAAFGRLEKVLERLAYVPRRAAVIAAPLLTRELRKQFRQGVDPYGRPWAPLAASTLAKGRRPPPLTDTGAAAGATKAMVRSGNRAGIHIVFGRGYLYFAQSGFRVGRTIVKPRRILPQQGMPAAWREILKRAAKQAFREAAK